jgi:Flp pilus assembly pilin Flp
MVSMMTSPGVLARIVLEEDGQDLVEYGLLAGIFATAAALLFPGILTKMKTDYSQWGTQVKNLWIPKSPQ